MSCISKAITELDADQLELVAALIARTLVDQRKVLILGNGGSCAMASHFATDLRLMAREAQIRVSVDALHESPSLITAMVNDYGFAELGAALIQANGSSGDTLLIFSCSGRSPNLVNAAHAATRLGVETVLIGSQLAPSDFPAHHNILVQANHYGVIEAAHSAVAHVIVDLLRIRFGVASLKHPRIPSCTGATDEA